jgi:hypothetical protein
LRRLGKLGGRGLLLRLLGGSGFGWLVVSLGLVIGVGDGVMFWVGCFGWTGGWMLDAGWGALAWSLPSCRIDADCGVLSGACM